MPPSHNKIPFQKPSLSFEQQLEQLKARGLVVEDDAYAIHYLSHLNYYRLGAYWLPFEQDHETHQFIEGTSFSDVLNLYVFDREFRLLLMDAIERVEVSVRTQFAYHLSQKYGAHAHLNPDVFHNLLLYSKSLVQLERDINRSKEKFIKHLTKTYQEDMPAIWAIVELMSLGQLSTWYENIGTRADRKLVADVYDFDEKILISFLRHLSYLRNLCAHHSRVWNRNCTITLILPTNRPEGLDENFNREEFALRKVYNTLVLIIDFMNKICPENHFQKRLKELITSHNIDCGKMGFPDSWEQLPIWQEN